MVLCCCYFSAVNFDWSIIFIRKSFRASRDISGKLGVKLAIYKSQMNKRYRPFSVYKTSRFAKFLACYWW